MHSRARLLPPEDRPAAWPVQPLRWVGASTSVSLEPGREMELNGGCPVWGEASPPQLEAWMPMERPLPKSVVVVSVSSRLRGWLDVRTPLHPERLPQSRLLPQRGPRRGASLPAGGQEGCPSLNGAQAGCPSPSGGPGGARAAGRLCGALSALLRLCFLLQNE